MIAMALKPMINGNVDSGDRVAKHTGRPRRDRIGGRTNAISRVSDTTHPPVKRTEIGKRWGSFYSGRAQTNELDAEISK